jgi:hypothetical protein
MEEFRNAYTLFVGKTKGPRRLASDNTKTDLHKQGRMVKYGHEPNVSGDEFMW